MLLFKQAVPVALALTVGTTISLGAQERADLDRPYDPVVVPCSKLGAFAGVPLDQVRILAYRADESRWEPIPFQIDERKAIVDPWDPVNIRLSYFAQDDGLVDDDDELVFLCRDLGDKAPPESWPDGAPVGVRVQLEVSDPVDGSRAWAYAYRYPTEAPAVPSPYDLSYDPDTDAVQTLAYRVRLGASSGLVEDVVLLPPFGSGVDIFDTQKIRMVGLVTAFNLTVPFGRDWNPYAASERDNLFVFPDSIRVTSPKVVRIVRQAIQAIRFGSLVFEDARFPVETKFYPFSGRVTGGTDMATLGELVDVEIELIRQSWDFNANATGMRLFTRYNSGILIDGQPDSVDRRVDLPIREWILATGDQGTFFAYVAAADTLGTQQTLYYRDDCTGGQSDGTQVEGGDTGDGVSYGDIGVLATGRTVKPNLRLDFAAYFLPSHQPREMGERLATWLEQPVVVRSEVQSSAGVASEARKNRVPFVFRLSPPYPNPFNQSVRFSLEVRRETDLTVRVLDAAGRPVCRLFRGRLVSGTHWFAWPGRDSAGRAVASGVYWIEALTSAEKRSIRVTLVR